MILQHITVSFLYSKVYSNHPTPIEYLTHNFEIPDPKLTRNDPNPLLLRLQTRQRQEITIPIRNARKSR